jgi:hypothetical protein
MGVREKIGELLYKRISKKIGNRLKSGMSALHSDGQWENGSFVVDFRTGGQITVHVRSIDDGERATVRAETEEKRGRKWSIPTNELDRGVDSAIGAVCDVKYDYCSFEKQNT